MNAMSGGIVLQYIEDLGGVVEAVVQLQSRRKATSIGVSPADSPSHLQLFREREQQPVTTRHCPPNPHSIVLS